MKCESLNEKRVELESELAKSVRNLFVDKLLKCYLMASRKIGEG